LLFLQALFDLWFRDLEKLRHSSRHRFPDSFKSAHIVVLQCDGASQ